MTNLDARAPSMSVVIPTLNRPEPLRRAIRSLMAQRISPNVPVEIIVADNSADASARTVVEALADGPAFPIRYVSEPTPGVSSARNRGVAEARGDYIAFLDDDEEASEDWLAGHLDVLMRTGAHASFGPVEVAADGNVGVDPFERYFNRQLNEADGADITDLAAYLGTNNSVFDAEKCFPNGAPFDVSLNRFGGEDSLLLQQIARSGGALVWSARSTVVEWVPPRRLSWDYVRRRRFLSGQIRCYVLDMLRPTPRVEIAAWMLIGAVQALVCGGLALATRPLAEQTSRHFAMIAWGGLGKIFWMRRFRPQLYGSGLVS